jgi:hypothetical protein
MVRRDDDDAIDARDDVGARARERCATTTRALDE